MNVILCFFAIPVFLNLPVLNGSHSSLRHVKTPDVMRLKKQQHPRVIGDFYAHEIVSVKQRTRSMVHEKKIPDMLYYFKIINRVKKERVLPVICNDMRKNCPGKILPQPLAQMIYEYIQHDLLDGGYVIKPLWEDPSYEPYIAHTLNHLVEIGDPPTHIYQFEFT